MPSVSPLLQKGGSVLYLNFAMFVFFQWVPCYMLWIQVRSVLKNPRLLAHRPCAEHKTKFRWKKAAWSRLCDKIFGIEKGYSRGLIRVLHICMAFQNINFTNIWVFKRLWTACKSSQSHAWCWCFIIGGANSGLACTSASQVSKCFTFLCQIPTVLAI